MALLRLVLVTAVTVLVACSNPTETPPRDAGSDVLPDVASPDSGPDALETWLAFELQSGDRVTGELIAVYDSARWWNPGDGLLYAVFDPERFAPYPNDRSIRFVWATEVRSIERTSRAVPGASYRQFLRDNQIVFRQPPLTDTSYVITGNESYHLDEDGFGDFAWDVERTDDAGRRFTGSGLQNEDYLVWDLPVVSGVAGEVIEIVADGVDNEPGAHPPIGAAVNNLVGIALGGSYYAYYLHFRENGVDPALAVGDRVAPGDVLGRAGNSGVSLEPHIHVVLLWYDVEAERSYAVPAEFADVLVAPTPTGPFDLHEYHVPATGEWLDHAE